MHPCKAVLHISSLIPKLYFYLNPETEMYKTFTDILAEVLIKLFTLLEIVTNSSVYEQEAEQKKTPYYTQPMHAGTWHVHCSNGSGSDQSGGGFLLDGK